MDALEAFLQFEMGELQTGWRTRRMDALEAFLQFEMGELQTGQRTRRMDALEIFLQFEMARVSSGRTRHIPSSAPGKSSFWRGAGAHPWPGGARSPLVCTAHSSRARRRRRKEPCATAGRSERSSCRQRRKREDKEGRLPDRVGEIREQPEQQVLGERFRGAALVIRTDAAEFPGLLPSAPGWRLPSQPDSGVEDAMARRHESVTRRMWTWAPGLLMVTVVFWGHQGNGQGQGKCKDVLIL
ncbi:uncharacterized protein LOC117098186 [Trachypithecus francoisi]|uniref:uncharacterized protein LOC117098186 n=1 Tax=Trachypithecus francoisi TaxID=54180 RepID=UPI00141ABA07|nr:uncharacterized protein LOC117098186 [Trachypithecus francoisi]